MPQFVVVATAAINGVGDLCRRRALPAVLALCICLSALPAPAQAPAAGQSAAPAAPNTAANEQTSDGGEAPEAAAPPPAATPMPATVPLFALRPESSLLSVWDAFRSRDVARLAHFAQNARGQLLEDYPQFWYLQATLTSADPAAVRDFLKRYADTPLAERLRADWLTQIATSSDWATFNAEYPALATPSAQLACLALQARLAAGDKDAAAEARSVWLAAKGEHDACNDLAEPLQAAAAINHEDLWQRLRLLLDGNHLSAAKRLNALLPNAQAMGEKALHAATQNPQRFLDKHSASLKTRAGRELTLYALARLARSDASSAVDIWSSKQDAFPKADRGAVWAMLAQRAAFQHEPQALTWFGQAGDTPLSDLQSAWKARAALRAQDWQAVLNAIGAMSATQTNEPAWRYWKARALKAGGDGAQANALFVELSKQVNFYGLLSVEEMGPVLGSAREPWKPSEAEVAALQSARSMQRALTLFRLGLNEEARTEWNYALRGFDDKQLLSAAEVARRANWYDRMISAADRTISQHDFSLRYPVPYREALEKGAQAQQLDAAWVFGLVRQESRFISDARSSAGAQGLMQLMPATARWVARRMGLNNYSPGEISEVSVNATLGSYYLKHVLDELGHPVLATAAYNAGPSRARRWMDAKPMEGAIYAETIPFSETRDYVKKVMANASIYAAQFGHKLLSLKQRLGTVPARGAAGLAASFE